MNRCRFCFTYFVYLSIGLWSSLFVLQSYSLLVNYFENWIILYELISLFIMSFQYLLLVA